MLFCHCKDCMRAKRKGKILGTRRMQFWVKGNSGEMEHYNGPVDAYVHFPRFAKGKRVRRGKWTPSNEFVCY